MRRWLVLPTLLISLAGCGLANRENEPERPAPAATAPGGDESVAAPARPEATQPLRGGEASPRAAVTRFARAWTNWTWETLADQERALRGLAAGELRERLTAAAEATERNGLLAVDRSEKRGEVIGLDIKPGDERRETIIVVRETLIANGRVVNSGVRHAVYSAVVVRGPDGWLIERWDALNT